MSPEQKPEAGKTLFSLQRRERLMEELRAHGAITVRDIAGKLGVSELTVRRDVNILADAGLVSRVHGGATLPSPLDRSVAAGKPAQHGYAIGMVVPSLNYYWPQVISGARAEADEQNLRILVRGSAYDAADNRRQVQALMDTQNIDGLIVAPDMTGELGQELLRWLNALPIPVVLAERRSPVETPAHRLEWVATDHGFGAGMAVRHLWQEGHRQIGCLSDSTSPTSPHVVRGWRQALAALKIPLEGSVHEDSAKSDNGDRARHFDHVLNLCRQTGTTAMLVHSDTQAVAFVQHCVDKGVQIPGDMAIVGYDDEVAYLAEPAISAVRPPKQYVGKVAVQLMAARLAEGRIRPIHRIELNPELILRGSSIGAPRTPAAKTP
ncbi:substrate-binding domain-containing protein [Pseudarthrobacter sp. J75]|uniref:LacI family DNA-binding transcriptional regulator n=1 Tax=unclassified Pseudarthrobacter TaxID=2647000 RepID=UPI002E8206CD|nr:MULTISPECIES: substrate-binding domain-containing protein [unclassified Pseudarthrobacter]MEE2524204.1 substrate-binding domain-containing protein [Pseudarthrobacter sp. J47]MEE2530242.1 substrate-binding domain-containing protein [Pseudarthrobacter sp. J75]MEE2568888.1 substrate-binding domain-containing protein [Pseudarthrobacter sp. J64]